MQNGDILREKVQHGRMSGRILHIKFGHDWQNDGTRTLNFTIWLKIAVFRPRDEVCHSMLMGKKSRNFERKVVSAAGHLDDLQRSVMLKACSMHMN